MLERDRNERIMLDARGSRGRWRLHRLPRLCPFLRHDPAAYQVRIQAVGQGHRGHRYAGPSAGRHHLRLELGAMRPPSPSTDAAVLGSVHVSTNNQVDTIILKPNPPGKMTSPAAYLDLLVGRAGLEPATNGLK